MHQRFVPSFVWLVALLTFAGCNQSPDTSAQIQTLNDKIRDLEQREQELKLQSERDKLDAERAALETERKNLEAQKAALASGSPVNRPVLFTASSNGPRHSRHSDPDDSAADDRDAGDDQPGPSRASYDVFYEDLQEGGHWFDDATYGYVWQPDVAAENPDWRPYTDGHWVYTDRGWTWVSNENFGWACYHYGRWARLRDRGWIWVPGDQWAPAWVSWRESDDQEYVGWAPLPPECEPQPDVRVQGWVDRYYDIGPAAYVFLKLADFVRPSYRQAVVPVQQNFTIIERTTNVTDIYYQNQGINVAGPRYDQVLQRVNRPVPKYQIDYVTPPQPNAAFQTAVTGERLRVVAPPPRLQPRATVVPPAAQAIRNAQIEKGWQNVDPNRARQIRQALARTEPQVPKSLPPQPAPPPKPVIVAHQAPPAAPAPPAVPPAPPAANDLAAQRARLEAERARLEQQKQALEQQHQQPPPAGPSHQGLNPPQAGTQRQLPPGASPPPPAPAGPRQVQGRESQPPGTAQKQARQPQPAQPGTGQPQPPAPQVNAQSQPDAARRRAEPQRQAAQGPAAVQKPEPPKAVPSVAPPQTPQKQVEQQRQAEQPRAQQQQAEQQRQQQEAARQRELEAQRQQQLKAQQEAAQRQAEQQRAQQEAAQRQAQQQAAQAAAQQQQEAQRRAQAEAAQRQQAAQQQAAQAAAQKQAQTAAAAHQQAQKAQAEKVAAEKAAAEKAAAEQRAKGQAPPSGSQPQ